MPSEHDIWYALSETEIVYAPRQNLETFGTSRAHYYVLSELMDTVGQVRIRQGIIHAERPRLITPKLYANELLDNFGEDARSFADWLIESGEALRILSYGLRFRKDEHAEETIGGELRAVADNIIADVKDRNDALYSVILGVDDFWEVSLVAYAYELVRQSAPTNFQALAKRGLLDSTSGNVPMAVRVEIQNDFRQAEGDPQRIKALGRKLRRYGLFEDYEDRFYALIKNLRR